MKDIHSGLAMVSALAPAVLTATNTGAALDLQGFNAALFIVTTGAIAGDGDFTTKIQESDATTSGDFTDVAAADLIGTIPDTLAANTTYKLGYVGAKRYVRQVTTLNSGTSIAAGIVLAKGYGHDNPQA